MYEKIKSNKVLMLVILLFGVMLLVSGGTFAFWIWGTVTEQESIVAFEIEKNDIGATLTGETQNVSNLLPVSSCTNENYAIKKKLTLTYYNNTPESVMITGSLSIDNFDDSYGIPSADNLSHLHYALTTSSESCTKNPVRGATGTFISTSGNLFTDVTLMGSVQGETSSASQTYYLWIWIDGDYNYQNKGSNIVTDPMQNLSFTLKWSGNLHTDRIEPEQPKVDSGMIPVKIANDGTVTTIAETDLSWYNYDNKEWANVVLVYEQFRNKYLGTTGVTVAEEDILAYYTWIPRYSYKILEMTCSEVSNPNEEEHMSCYKGVISSEDKTLLINWWYDFMVMFIENNGIAGVYTLENATTDIETVLNSGYAYIEVVGLPISFLEMITMYNEQNDPDIDYESTFMPNNKLNKNLPRTIDVSFESKNASILTGDAINTYRTHPAFTFGNKNISGIWVGKFEATGDGTTPTVLPNSKPITMQNISTQFQTSLKFAGGTLSNGIVSFAGSSTYGLTANTDSHMMKNSEWGAVVYLSHSVYGINEEIRINNYYGDYDTGFFKTGCGALEPNASQTTECQISYGGASSYPQSTTGNISGVFDMSGGAWEFMMGVLADDSGNPRSGTSLDYNSGFNGLLGDGTSYSSGIPFPITKYYDLYTSSNPLTACNGGICYGHALSETLSWYGDSAYFVSPDYPWFVRGGGATDGVRAGAFYSFGVVGMANSGYFWRPVLVAD